jgi:hypothetical protein
VSEEQFHGWQQSRGGVQHAADAEAAATASTASRDASFALCGARPARTKAGAVKRRIRFCQPVCRLNEVRDRRAAARAELAKALCGDRDLDEQRQRLRLGARTLRPAARATTSGQR